MRLRILSINVRGLGMPAKRNLVSNELAKLDFDLFLLQETHISGPQAAQKFERLWRGKCLWSFGVGKSAGVAVLVSPRFSGDISRFRFDSDGRILSLLLHMNGLYFNLLNIYAPNAVSDRKIFFQTLHQFFLSKGDTIIGGDFNCIDSELDRLNSTSNFSADKKLLQVLQSDFCLCDVWRKQNPRGISFTWMNSGKTQASRLDRFYVSRSLLQTVRSNTVLPCVFSDHDFVELCLDSDLSRNRRSSIWKFNTALLSDSDFMQLMTNVIQEQKRVVDNFNSYGDWWDNLKNTIRKTCIDFCVRKRKESNLQRSRLTKRLIFVKNKFHAGDLSVIGEMKDLESALSALVLKEAQGAIIRSRAQWLEEGEKPTRYFFRLENNRAEKNSFSSLFDSHGTEQTSQSEIEHILENFYTSLFTKDVLDLQIQSSLIDDLDLSLSEAERSQCEGLFSQAEILAAIKGLQTGKSPGSDGLPVEFYSAFWEDLCDVLVVLFNERFHLGVLTDTQREGFLRLLHKKDDKRLPKNWRPISLLNSDYKIASKVITERLKAVMPSIVHSDQTCGVVGRNIFSNLLLVRDSLDMIDKTDETGILVTLDQEKAFDRVDHDFLLRVLVKFGFGPNFCQWVRLFYNNVFSRIICNGNLTAPIFLGRGVRQGCPLSPLLYVLVSEVLSTQVRKCREIEGFRLPGAGGLQFKISQYADDATNFLKTERSLRLLLETVRTYEKGSGAKLNTSKSEAMWLGRWRANTATPFGLKWVNKMRILGVHFSNGLLSVENDNWKHILDKMETVLNLWSQRDLSFLGRAMIVNVLGASRFWHVAKVLPPPGWVVQRYNKIVWPFIWKGKMESVSRQRCCAPVNKGGLNIVDFQTKCLSLRLSTLVSLRDSFGSQKWHFLARYFLSNRLVKFDARFSFSSISVPSASEPSRFYKLCLTALSNLYEKHGSLPDEFSCKNLYCLLFNPPEAAPKCAGFWGALVRRPINRWATVWRKSRLKLIENKKNDILWLIMHRAVRVRYALKTWGYIDNDKCAVCSNVESIEHCFFVCGRARRVWDFFSPHLSRLSGSPFSVSSLSVFFPLSDSVSSPGRSLSQYLIATILFWLWHSRNLATFRNSCLDSSKITDLIRNDIKLRVRCQSLDSVRNFWSLHGVLCLIDDKNQITFGI